jgi:hypothetical protein
VQFNSSILSALKPNDSSASKLITLRKEADGKFEAYLNNIKVDMNNRVAEKVITKIQTELEKCEKLLTIGILTGQQER